MKRKLEDSFKKEVEQYPHCSLQLSEDRKWRGMSNGDLPYMQRQAVWEWFKVVSEEV